MRPGRSVVASVLHDIGALPELIEATEPAALELIGPDPEVRHAPLPREVLRPLLDRIQRDVDGSEMDAVLRLLREHRVLCDHVTADAGGEPESERANVGRYVAGVMLRVAELAGGRLGIAERAHVNAAHAHLRRCLGTPVPVAGREHLALLPYDDRFVERARRFRRPQPNLLDLVLEELFENPAAGWRMDGPQRAWVYLQAWKAVLVVDRVWDGPTLGG